MFNVYAVRDINLAFNQPFCDKNDSLAKRGFAYAINNNDVMQFRPSDFELFCLGQYDDEKGELIPQLPELICRGSDVVADR